VFHSVDSAATWAAVNEGLSDTAGYRDIYSLAVIGDYLFAGTGSGIFRRPLAEMITSVKPSPSFRSGEFALQQNYPNPFNPSTTISYQLPVNTRVTLKIYDVLGREVKLLVNEEEHSGIHTVKFDGSDLPTGVYFSQLTAGAFIETKKMVLLR
jgi:Secretion system C-terminal sorting domain